MIVVALRPEHTDTPPIVRRDVMIMQFVGNFPTLNLRSRKVNVHTTYGRTVLRVHVCVCPRETWVLGTTQLNNTGLEYLTCVVYGVAVHNCNNYRFILFDKFIG